MSSISLDDAESSQTIILVPKEGKGIEVGYEVARNMNPFVKAATSGELVREIDVNVPRVDLERIVEYMNEHFGNPPKDIPKPLPDNESFDKFVSEFDYKFVQMDKSEIFSLINSANYFGIQSLLHLLCARVVSLMDKKDINYIKNIRVDDDKE
jgi:hypothetical protein